MEAKDILESLMNGYNEMDYDIRHLKEENRGLRKVILELHSREPYKDISDRDTIGNYDKKLEVESDMIIGKLKREMADKKYFYAKNNIKQ